MNYTEIYTNRRGFKIPTIFSFLIVGLVTFLIARFFLDVGNYSTASRQELTRLEIVNVFPNQATVFWQTGEKRTAWIIYGTNENKLDRIALDQKDTEKNKRAYKNHYMVLTNLEEDQRYYFKLVIDNKLLSREGNKPFTLTTVSDKIGVSNLKPAYGKVLDQSGKALENAVILLSIRDTYLLASLSKNSGEWLIPLNYVISKNVKKLKVPANDEAISLEIIDEEGKKSNIKTQFSSLSPLVETVIVGKDYDLLEKKDVLAAVSESNQNSIIDITFPRERATIPGTNPLIKGKAIANNSITVRVTDGPSSTTMQTKADAKGNWQTTLPGNLSPGPHQLVMQTKDASGNSINKTRSFTIAKSGEVVLGEATDSATPTVTLAPSTSTTSTPTPIKNLTPTIPVSGTNMTYIGISSAALVLLGLGLLIIF